jgi:chorismate mutase/prephenate dehydratase
MELSEIRTKLDALDAELLRLFLRRMEYSEEAARYKAAHNLPVLDSGREQEILGQIRSGAGKYAQEAEALFTAILSLSRSRQEALLKRGEDVL